MFTTKPYQYHSTNKKFIEFYDKREPIAVQTVTNNCSIDILDIVYGIEDYVIVRGYVNDLHKYKIHYNNQGRAYFKYCNGCRYFLDEFMRLAV